MLTFVPVSVPLPPDAIEIYQSQVTDKTNLKAVLMREVRSRVGQQLPSNIRGEMLEGNSAVEPILIPLTPSLYKEVEGLALDRGLGVGEIVAHILTPRELPSNSSGEMLEGNLEPEAKLPIGYLAEKIIKGRKYYYWRYYKKSGRRADLYLSPNRDTAIAMAWRMGIPEDANPKFKKR